MEKLKNEILRLVDINPEYKKHIPYDDIKIDNYRKTVSPLYLAELGSTIENNGLLQAPGLIDMGNGEYELVFGQCRVLACKDYTSHPTLPEAKIWPKSALKYKQTIALLENIGRKDAPIKEEIAGIKRALNEEFSDFDNPRDAFKKQTGLTDNVISIRLKIGDAMEQDSDFHKIVDDGIVEDPKTLYNIAQAIIMQSTPGKKKYVNQLNALLLDGKLKGDKRKISDDVKNHVKSGGTRPVLESVDDAPKETKPKAKSESPARLKKITAKQIETFANRFDQDVVMDDDAKNTARNLITKLQSLLNEA